MSLTILQPSEGPLISIEEAKTYLRVDTDAENDLITRLIAASTEALEMITGRSFLQKTYQYITHVTPETSSFPYFKNFPSVLQIPLPRPPMQRIVSVTLKTQLQDQEIPPENYKTFESHGPTQLTVTLPGSLCPAQDPMALLISFIAGWSETAQGVPEPLRLATLMLIADAYEKRDGYSAQGGLPLGVSSLIQPYRLINLW
ncbi:MAG: head-tail connector protein [Holosporales bacterium]|jgi:uncharacterized phiE125 gp8 family phage protein|nr:head-tail connector protein [Holosporales bacterium]